MPSLDLKVLIRGAGEQASAVAYRLVKCHFKVVMTEVTNPEAVRRGVTFSEAVFDKTKEVEGITGKLVTSIDDIFSAWGEKKLPVIVDPTASIAGAMRPDVLVDATMAKKNIGTSMSDAPLVVGLGVGFVAGSDVHVVIETNRGHNLGRVISQGSAEPDTGHPGIIAGFGIERVLRAPCDGVLISTHQIGDDVSEGEIIANVDHMPVVARISGVIRGLLRSGTAVTQGMKLGDVDPRANKEYCYTISDKGRAIAGGVLEAILSHFNS